MNYVWALHGRRPQLFPQPHLLRPKNGVPSELPWEFFALWRAGLEGPCVTQRRDLRFREGKSLAPSHTASEEADPDPGLRPEHHRVLPHLLAPRSAPAVSTTYLRRCTHTPGQPLWILSGQGFLPERIEMELSDEEGEAPALPLAGPWHTPSHFAQHSPGSLLLLTSKHGLGCSDWGVGWDSSTGQTQFPAGNLE